MYIRHTFGIVFFLGHPVFVITFCRYRYTEWGGTQVNSELYDYQDDPDETTNYANDNAYVDVRRTLRTVLHDGWYEAKV